MTLDNLRASQCVYVDRAENILKDEDYLEQIRMADLAYDDTELAGSVDTVSEDTTRVLLKAVKGLPFGKCQHCCL